MSQWKPITEDQKCDKRIFVLNDRGAFAVEWSKDWNGSGWWICQDGKYNDRPLRGSHPTHYIDVPQLEGE